MRLRAIFRRLHKQSDPGRLFQCHQLPEMSKFACDFNLSEFEGHLGDLRWIPTYGGLPVGVFSRLGMPKLICFLIFHSIT